MDWTVKGMSSKILSKQKKRGTLRPRNGGVEEKSARGRVKGSAAVIWKDKRGSAASCPSSVIIKGDKAGCMNEKGKNQGGRIVHSGQGLHFMGGRLLGNRYHKRSL